eukprot:765504-Hanusia_phi.AAC.5
MLDELRARALIEQSRSECSPALLNEAYQVVKDLSTPPTLSNPKLSMEQASPELYVLISETSLDLSSPSRTEDQLVSSRIHLQELAYNCLQSFMSSKPSSDQFLARAYLAYATLACRWAEGRKGDGLVDAVLKALDFVMRALNLALESLPRYQFLVYNASVVYWRCSRPLQRKGYFQHILNSMPQMCDALMKLESEDVEWKSKYIIALARAYDFSDRSDDAGKLLQNAVGMMPNLSEETQVEIVRLLVHIDRAKGGAAADRIASSPKLGLFARLQKVKSGIISDDKVPEELEDLIKSSSEAGEFKVLAEVGRLCLLKGQTSCAQNAIKAIGGGKDAGMAVTVLTECTKAQLSVLSLGEEAEMYTRKMVDTRLDALSRLEKALPSAVRSKDANVIHEICSLAWSLCLPILQPNLRKQAKRVLQACCKALEDIDSPLHELRVQLYLEVARCDVADDLYAAAAVQVQKGLALDYFVPEDLIVEYKRPFDKHLNLMKKKLSMKMSLYSAPDRPEDKAMLLIEQARESKEAALRASLLDRAVGILSAVLTS